MWREPFLLCRWPYGEEGRVERLSPEDLCSVFLFILYVRSRADQLRATPLHLGPRQQQSLLQLRGEAFSLSPHWSFFNFFFPFSERLKQQLYMMKLWRVYLVCLSITLTRLSVSGDRLDRIVLRRSFSLWPHMTSPYFSFWWEALILFFCFFW